MKWKWKCNICGAEGRKYILFYKAGKNIRKHSNNYHNGIIDIDMIREDGVIRKYVERSDEEIVVSRKVSSTIMG